MTYNEFEQFQKTYIENFKAFISEELDLKLISYKSAKEFADSMGLSEAMLSRYRNGLYNEINKEVFKLLLGDDILDRDVDSDWKKRRIQALENELKRLKEDTDGRMDENNIRGHEKT